ncbi:MAG TPA: hypothetical protein VMM57_12080 [Bacteroidota bacterium]|nr:hypothetical protein [Bacteroidota bacterium]
MDDRTTQYRILITRTLDVPQNILHEMYATEEAAVKAAQQKLIDLDADVAVVMEQKAGYTKVLQRFERIRKAG